MLADQTACIAAIAARLATETRRVGGVIFWQIGGVEDLLRMVIRHRHLGRRDKGKPASIFYMKQIVLKFRQLIRSKQRRPIYKKGWQRFHVSILARMDVEHKIDESTAQT